MSFLGFVLKRILLTIPVIFGVLTITFFLSRLMPGDPVMQLLLQAQVRLDPYMYNQIMNQLGLNLPLHLQYFKYLGDIFTGNWGESLVYARGTDVWELIIFRLPKTIDLAFFGMVIASFVGIKIGIISATHRNKVRDTIFRSIGIIGVAFPVFVLGMLLQYWVAYQFPLFPMASYKTALYTDPPFVTGFYMIDALISGQFYKIPDYIYHLLLPIFCLSFVTLAGIVRQTRSSMLEVLQQDYIRTAKAKGCVRKHVIKKHALKNSLIPTVTVIGLNVATLLSGTVLLESTFGLPGMGLLLVDAALTRDYWLLISCMVVLAFIYIFTTLILDIIYGIIDPRIRY
jgi:ABC-type dipeptide/oligopeptide/nickel transport system permease component